MENRTDFASIDNIISQELRINLNLQSDPEIIRTREEIDILIAEGGETMYNYVNWLGLVKDPNLIVLSSIHHYYFDADDLKDVNTIINLKQINLIKNISDFFHSIFQVISCQSNFIGSFFDSKIHNGHAIKDNSSKYQGNNNVELYDNGIISRIPLLNTIYNILDSKTNRDLTKKDVYSLLREHGFKVMDMTELNGLTYFHSKKAQVYDN